MYGGQKLLYSIDSPDISGAYFKVKLSRSMYLIPEVTTVIVYHKNEFFIFAAVECEQLEDPDNGNVVLSGTTLGSLATYSCIEGYELNGEEQRTCQMDRTWSGVEPTCDRKQICIDTHCVLVQRHHG